MKELSDIITFLGQRLEANLIKLEDISKLEYNWNGYNAKPIPKEIIEKVKEVIIKLGNDKQPEIFPTGRETIQIEFEYTKRRIYYELEGDLHIPKVEKVKEVYQEYEFLNDKIQCLIINESLSKKDRVIYEGPISENDMYNEINKIFNKYHDYYKGQDIKMVIDINKPLYQKKK